MNFVLRLIQWGNSAPFGEVSIDLSREFCHITIGHPPPGATRTETQCWLKFDVIEFDHADVWRHGDRIYIQNGDGDVFVNGSETRRATVVQTNDIVRLGGQPTCIDRSHNDDVRPVVARVIVEMTN